jgi:CheY-like chemotaxis protein
MPVKAGKPVILCIEDHAGHLKLRRALLESSGYSVVSAATGAEALRQLRDWPVSLVISDHMLGDGDGNDLAKEIRRMDPMVPILLYTGAIPEHLGQANCFLSKTEPAETFLAMVAALIERYLT